MHRREQGGAAAPAGRFHLLRLQPGLCGMSRSASNRTLNSCVAACAAECDARFIASAALRFMPCLQILHTGPVADGPVVFCAHRAAMRRWRTALRATLRRCTSKSCSPCAVLSLFSALKTFACALPFPAFRVSAELGLCFRLGLSLWVAGSVSVECLRFCFDAQQSRARHAKYYFRASVLRL